MFDRIIKDAIEAANVADRAFDTAIRQAGYKSRWDWFLRGAPASLQEAYNLKVEADRAMHDAFAMSRGEKI